MSKPSASQRRVAAEREDVLAYLRQVLPGSVQSLPSIRLAIAAIEAGEHQGLGVVCKSCETRRRAGFDGLCPACASERALRGPRPCTSQNHAPAAGSALVAND